MDLLLFFSPFEIRKSMLIVKSEVEIMSAGNLHLAPRDVMWLELAVVLAEDDKHTTGDVAARAEC